MLRRREVLVQPIRRPTLVVARQTVISVKRTARSLSFFVAERGSCVGHVGVEVVAVSACCRDETVGYSAITRVANGAVGAQPAMQAKSGGRAPEVLFMPCVAVWLSPARSVAAVVPETEHVLL